VTVLVRQYLLRDRKLLRIRANAVGSGRVQQPKAKVVRISEAPEVARFPVVWMSDEQVAPVISQNVLRFSDEESRTMSRIGFLNDGEVPA
jgi:hypothetical protein